jgi:outer membrane biosynthesis protein TonB
MKTLKSLAIVSCVGLFLLASNIGAKADVFDKTTTMTFSGPVQVEKTTLPAGTYVFTLSNDASEHIVRIYNEDETHLITTILAIPDARLEPSDKTVVKFAETSAGSETSGTIPDSGLPIKEWFYPGETSGAEFRVMPQQMAATQPEPVAAPTPSPEPEAESSPSPEPAQAAPAAPEAQTETPQAAPTEPAPEQPAQPAAPEQLPQTASQMPLLGLIGIVSLTAAASFRFVLKRWA